MRKGQGGNPRWIAKILPIVLLCVLGCDPVVRHKVLTFFFDGVPPLETSNHGQDSARKNQKRAKTPNVLKTAGKKPAKKPGIPRKTARRISFAHPPYAMKMCDSCHEVRGKGGAPMGFMFVEEKLKLCAMCHFEMSQEELGNNFKWVHAPVQYGACLECHHPHETDNPLMLKRWPIQKLCFKCHNAQRLLKTKAHSDIGPMDCTVCHDPHASPYRYMLRTKE